jgi:HEAT repeat protein
VKADDYLKRIEKELGEKVEAVKGRVSRLRTAANPRSRLSLEERCDAVRGSVDKLSDLPKSIPALLELLADGSQPEELRRTALSTLMAARFIVTTFAPHRAEFIRVLRALLPGAGPELREAALEALSLEKDPEAQALLLKGLEDPSVALVPATSALQYLSYDDHSSYAPAVREIVTNTEDPELKTAGLRLLATDSGSEQLFRDLIADLDQFSEVRQISAAALQALNPAGFEKIARDIVADHKDYDEIRAASLGALAHVKDFAETRSDPKFVAQVDEIKEKATGFLRNAASQFLKRSR